MTKDTITIVLLRHGRSRADDEKVHEGWYDSPLTGTGIAQVESRAEDLLERGHRFDRIIASPFQRAAATARIIAERLHTPLEFDDDWKEMNNGPLAGMSYEQADREYPHPEFRNPYEPFFETGESAWEIYRRAARGVERVICRGAGMYLVVAHGGILNQALRSIMGLPPSVNNQGIYFPFGDTGYVHLEYVPATHRWFVVEFIPGITE